MESEIISSFLERYLKGKINYKSEKQRVIISGIVDAIYKHAKEIASKDQSYIKPIAALIKQLGPISKLSKKPVKLKSQVIEPEY